jgi:hypothetical protein
VARLKFIAIQTGIIVASLIMVMLVKLCFSGAFQNVGKIEHVLLFSFFLFSFNFILKVHSLWKSIHTALCFLVSKYPKADLKVQTADEISELSGYFAKNPHLSHAWQEFREGIVIDESAIGPNPPVFNSDNSHAFFDEYAVIESNMYTQFWINLPGMFTAGGIFGTFWGLVQTLRDIKGEGDDQAALGSVMQALPGMHTAFYCSLVGVGLYILFSLLERFCMSVLSRAVSRLQAKIDSIVVRVSEQSLLYSMQGVMREQDAKFKTLNHTLMVTVGEEILNNRLSDVSKQLGALLEHQQESRVEERQHQAEYQEAVRETLRETLSPLLEKIDNVMAKQSNSAADKISGAVSGVLGSLGENLERASAEASRGFQQAAEKLGSTLLECNNQMQNMGTELNDLNTKVKQSAEGLNQSAWVFSEAAQKGRVILDGLSDAVTTLQPTMEAQRATIDTCSEVITRSESANSAMVEMTNKVSDQVTGLLGRLDNLSDRVAGLTETTASQTTEMNTSLAQASQMATNAMDSARSALAGLLDSVREQIDGYKGSVDAYSTNVRDGLSRIFSAFDQETERLVTAYAGVCDTTRKHSMELVSQTEEMCRSNVSVMKETSDTLVKLSTAIRDVNSTGSSLKEIDAQLKSIFERVKKAQVA